MFEAIKMNEIGIEFFVSLFLPWSIDKTRRFFDEPFKVTHILLSGFFFLFFSRANTPYSTIRFIRSEAKFSFDSSSHQSPRHNITSGDRIILSQDCAGNFRFRLKKVTQ